MKSDCNVTLSTDEKGKAWVSSDLDIHGVQQNEKYVLCMY